MKLTSNTLTGDPTLVESGFTSPPNDPILLLQRWFISAKTLKVSEPRDLVLATVGQNSVPTSRVVRIEECDDTGIIFGTSSTTIKSQNIELNPIVAGTLWWRETMQQINFSGSVSKCIPEKSDQVFADRLRRARAVTIVSNSSQVLIDENMLREQVDHLIKSSDNIARPNNWSAYHINIQTIEFWHGSKDRLHKRLRYTLDNNSVWTHQRLQP